jgi:hypothetical protein
MANMTNAPYFDEEAHDAATDDGEVRAMAHRQFGISLVVAFALLVVAGLMAVRAPHDEASVAMAAPHKIAGVQAPQMVGAQPVLAMNKE